MASGARLAVVAAVLSSMAFASCTYERVSVSSSGGQADERSLNAAVSADGRFVAFDSGATNLVPGDTRDDDVFLHDRTSRETVLVSRTAEGNEASNVPALSADGSRVAFQSGARSLVPGDTNDRTDVFVWERSTGQITRASVSSTEEQANDGSVNWPGEDAGIAISRHGRYVAFNSLATNLAPGDDNGLEDVFVRDTAAGTTTRIPAEVTGEPATEADGSRLYGIGDVAISQDGSKLAFASIRTVEVRPGFHTIRLSTDIYVHDLRSGATRRVSDGAQRGQAAFGVSLNGDGSKVAFSSSASDLVAGDTNDLRDLFVRELPDGPTVRIPADTLQEQEVQALGQPSLSQSGRYVSFWSEGGFVAFPGANLYLTDLRTNRTRLLTRNVPVEAGKLNSAPALSADGRWVAFVSGASDLVPDDTNGVDDAFLTPGRLPRAP